MSRALTLISNAAPQNDHVVTGLDASEPNNATDRARILLNGSLLAVKQLNQIHNPDSVISLHQQVQGVLMERYAESLQGVSPADYARYKRCFWEIHLSPEWRFWQSTTPTSIDFGGREHVLWWSEGFLTAVDDGRAFIRGRKAWGKDGVVVTCMRTLPVTLYTGEVFDNNVAVILPKNPLYTNAIWSFCQTPEFRDAVRRINQKVAVANATMVKVPFDLERWQRVADEAGPLPEPYSNDPTQWLFGGYPVGSTEPLQVAVALLLGYHWPQQQPDGLDAYADRDGIVCLPPLPHERPAAQQLHALLAAAYGADWSPAQQERLLAAADCGGKGLDEWLRDGFFVQHCRLFHNRPFIWHIWDGRKDGFSALVNYHRLDGALLERLIYTYLGTWIGVQRDAADSGVAGAEGRLVAAQELQRKLQAIREGEPPYDVYVRWKPLHQQPIGWEPDLNDGVRLNVRPFVKAEVLRARFTIHWKKDRGTNPDGSERLNDVHLTRAQKHAARQIVQR